MSVLQNRDCFSSSRFVPSLWQTHCSQVKEKGNFCHHRNENSLKLCKTRPEYLLLELVKIQLGDAVGAEPGLALSWLHRP